MSCLGKMLGLMILLLCHTPIYSALPTDDEDDPPYHDCSNNAEFSYIPGSIFEEHLNHILSTQILTNTALPTYSKFTNGTGIDQVYALYFCRGDVDVNTCRQCIKYAVQEIVQKCKLKKQGIVWYEFCTLRYANYAFFSLDEESPFKLHRNSTSLVSDPILKPHNELIDKTMNNLFIKAAYNKLPLGFATSKTNLSSNQKLQGFAQCSPYISSNLCEKCLSHAYSQMHQSSITTVFLPSCNIGFDLVGSPPSPGPSASHKPDSLSGAGETNNTTEAMEEGPQIEESRLQLARFTYSQVKDMTNEFNRKLGEGGYGIVYYGCLSDNNNKEVAVKVLSKNDAPKQFSNEVNVLGRIYHKNLVTLIGYCEEGTSNLALIYEYMSGGDLKALLSVLNILSSLLSENAGVVVSWKRRLAIAFDTAQGLDYLHTGCSPPIVHRDVKPANILLNQHFLQAKVADFGFSKIFPAEYVSKLETRVIGTTGYLDPQYHLTGQVNEKSDVYSFGIVLFELITGKSAIIKYTNTHLVQWVTPLYERGDIGSILDPRIRVEVGENYNTIWRATELAKQCVELDAAHRPTMSNIVIELRECLAMENVDVECASSVTTSMEMMTAPVTITSIGPQPRQYCMKQ
ncbi:hypothetical protein SOVF_102970 [Spinacia oleracea]|nr:hypothetical protein SOVF_102970 [Spinacia oleracea]